MSQPILEFPLESAGPFVLDKDASGFAVDGILSQYRIMRSVLLLMAVIPLIPLNKTIAQQQQKKKRIA